ncbi:MAG: DEAD/DEAH box helicase family protein [Clostridia bacterium]|nr:DEAD/DEAH box helicase family protein [Clostridia bacterium]
MSLELYPHQQETCKNLTEIYKEHRSAGGMMITGGGKSFVGMHQMIAAKNNPNYHGISEDGKVQFEIANGVVNDAKIYYVSPTTDIALQIQKDIAEFILDKSEEEIKIMSPVDLEKIVRDAFPNLHFICYQGLNSANLEGPNSGINLDNATPDLVILDEVHRSGAKTFRPAISRLLGFVEYEIGDEEEYSELFENVDESKYPDYGIGGENIVVRKNPKAIPEKENIQLLSLSATPERDVDSVDMIGYWSKLIGNYTEEELSKDVRADLGIKLNLHEAVEKRNLIKPPKVISFDANLVETEQYQEMVAQITNYRISPSLRKEIEARVREINRRLFGEEKEDFHLLPQEEQDKIKLNKNAEVMAKAIQDGDFKLSGKYIVFSPSKRGKNNEIIEEIDGEEKKDNSKATMDHLKSQYGKIDEIVRLAIEKLGIEGPKKIEDYYLSSQGQDIQTNKKVLKDFDGFETTEKEPLRFVTATQKLDEGVHVAGLSGSFMLKPIAEAGETITLRGQSIRFLQEVGRNMSAGNKETRCLFDYCNNVFRQSLNKVLEADQTIKEFELNEQQQYLADQYHWLEAAIPSRGQLQDDNIKLLAVLESLRKYYTPLNADIIKGNLAKTLENPIFAEHINEIFEELRMKGFEDIANKPKSFALATNLKKARQLLYSGGKCFSTFNIKELEELGFLDRTSKDGIKEFQKSKFVIDSKGFVQSASLEHLIFQNVQTGTKYDLDGKDVDGYPENYFDEKTGRDAAGFDRRGFNEKGVHKSGQIHDERGFMTNGINIQTGTKYDLAGFDENGYRKFEIKDIDPETEQEMDIDDVVVDRDGKFHTVFRDPETGELDYGKISKVPMEYYELQSGVKIDSRGFISTNNINILTERNGYSKKTSQFRLRECTVTEKDGRTRRYMHAFVKFREKSTSKVKYMAFEGYDLEHLMKADSEFPIDGPAYNIDGYDKYGFNENGAHRETGTRFDPKGNTRLAYASSISSKTQEFLKQMKLGDNFYFEGFGPDGKNELTNEYLNIYGFSLLHYGAPAWKNETNEFGFKVSEIPSNIYKDSRKNLIEKNYKLYEVKGRKVETNIFGTDTCGRLVKTGKLDPSIGLTTEYVEKCINGNMSEEEFFRQYSIQHKLLEQETKSRFKNAINKSIMLYRICPDLARTNEAKKLLSDIAKAPSDKLNGTIFANCPSLGTMLKMDVEDLNSRIAMLDRAAVKFKDQPDKLQSAKLQKELLEEKMQSLEELKKKLGDSDRSEK